MDTIKHILVMGHEAAGAVRVSSSWCIATLSTNMLVAENLQ